MKAQPISREREVISDNAFVELVIWALPKPLAGSDHSYKYRLALVVNGECVMRYDNEAGKGDHRHVDGRETAYEFRDLEKLLDDFYADVERLI